RPPLRFLLFPYTTLFRSLRFPFVTGFWPTGTMLGFAVVPMFSVKGKFAGFTCAAFPAVPPDPNTFPFKLNGPSSQSKPSSLRLRSEEHTSELQSPDHLVC